MPKGYFYIQLPSFIFLINIIRPMQNVVLKADPRATDERTSHLRQQNIVPAVVYGRTQEPIAIKIDNSSLLRAYRNAGESTIIELKVGKIELEVLVHDVQRDPVTGDFTHMDFYAVTRWEKVHTNIALSFVGESAATKEGAVIEEVFKEIDVKCLPRHLVENFEVDLSKLENIGDVIRFSDLWIDTELYEVHMEDDAVIATASAPKVVEEEPVEVEGEEAEGEEGAETAEAGTEGEAEESEQKDWE